MNDLDGAVRSSGRSSAASDSRLNLPTAQPKLRGVACRLHQTLFKHLHLKVIKIKTMEGAGPVAQTRVMIRPLSRRDADR